MERNSKNCIACDESISQNAKLCRHCGTMQNDQRFTQNFQEKPELIVGARRQKSNPALWIACVAIVLAFVATYEFTTRGVTSLTQNANANNQSTNSSSPVVQKPAAPAKSTEMPEVVIDVPDFSGEWYRSDTGQDVWGYGANFRLVAGNLPGCDTPFVDINFIADWINTGTGLQPADAEVYGGTTITASKLGPHAQESYHVWIPAVPGKGAKGHIEVLNAYCG